MTRSKPSIRGIWMSVIRLDLRRSQHDLPVRPVDPARWDDDRRRPRPGHHRPNLVGSLTIGIASRGPRSTRWSPPIGRWRGTILRRSLQRPRCRPSVGRGRRGGTPPGRPRRAPPAGASTRPSDVGEAGRSRTSSDARVAIATTSRAIEPTSPPHEASTRARGAASVVDVLLQIRPIDDRVEPVDHGEALRAARSLDGGIVRNPYAASGVSVPRHALSPRHDASMQPGVRRMPTRADSR